MKKIYFLLSALIFCFTACSKDDAKISALSFDVSEEYLVAGDTMTLAITISPSDASVKGIVWSSSNADVASVENGKVTALSAGTAAITASAVDGSKTVSCNITVGDVYICLREGLSESELGNAFMWKNGDKQLIMSDEERDFTIKSMFVDGSDVYLAGFFYDNKYLNSWPVLWKNGTASILPHSVEEGTYMSDYSVANSVYISGSDVYVVGNDFDKSNGGKIVAALWKNGTESFINDGSKTAARAYSVFVSDGSIYVSGSTYQFGGETNKYLATVWKDGTPEYLNDGKTEDLTALSVCKSGSNIFVSGLAEDDASDFSVAVLWKNGVRTNLSDGTSAAKANSLCTYKEDSYVAGYSYNGSSFVAQLWKNGSPIVLRDDGGSNSSAMSACVFGDKVYVAGYVMSLSGTVTCIWTVDCNSGEVISERVIAENEIPFCIVVK